MWLAWPGAQLWCRMFVIIQIQFSFLFLQNFFKISYNLCTNSENHNKLDCSMRSFWTVAVNDELIFCSQVRINKLYFSIKFQFQTICWELNYQNTNICWILKKFSPFSLIFYISNCPFFFLHFFGVCASQSSLIVLFLIIIKFNKP